MRLVTFLQIYYIFFIFQNFGANAAMTEAQVKATGKLVRNTCQPKAKATDEDIDKMRSGDWNVDHTTMCYLHCVIISQKIMTKENKVDVSLAKDLARNKLPASLRDAALESIEKCKDSAKTLNDKCVAAYEVAKCFYEANPEKYFLP